jgi:hypothetical protein
LQKQKTNRQLIATNCDSNYLCPILQKLHASVWQHITYASHKDAHMVSTWVTLVIITILKSKMSKEFTVFPTKSWVFRV